MFSLENIREIAKVFIVSLLCSEMQLNDNQNDILPNQVVFYNTKTNSTKATFSNSQHHASIRLKEHDQDFGDGHICSGVVISPSAVLTTAKCVYNYNKNKAYHPSELKVVLATTRRYQRHKQTLIFSVTHSYQPETFNASSLRDNVAILLLERDIPIVNEYVKPITLTDTKILSTNCYDKQYDGKLKVTTWLKTKEGLSLNHLMLLNVSKVSNEICLQYYGEGIFSTGSLCLHSNESLNKDFGSPLFIDNQLVAVRSFALSHPSPAIYSDISHHTNWIRGIIGDGSNQNDSIWGILGILLLSFVALKSSMSMKW